MSLTDIESKVTELSILRILGMRKLNVIIILILKGIYFSAPAYCIGLLMSYGSRVYMSGKVEDILKLKLDTNLSDEIIKYSILLGFVMPIVSSIIPARRAI